MGLPVDSLHASPGSHPSGPATGEQRGRRKGEGRRTLLVGRNGTWQGANGEGAWRCTTHLAREDELLVPREYAGALLEHCVDVRHGGAIGVERRQLVHCGTVFYG